MNLYYDIETVPTQEQEIIDAIAETVNPPGNYKKQETIDKWLDETKPGLVEEKVLKTALDGAYGQVISIAWAIDNNPITGIIRTLDEPEEDLIKEFFFQVFPNQGDFNYRICGSNIVKFDNRFLWQRSLVNDIEVPVQFQTAVNARPWEHEKVFDIMYQWTGTSHEYVSVDKLCQAFGIKSSKTNEIDGSRVWEHVQKGNYDLVLNYNKDDVRAERELCLKMGVDQW